MKITVIGGGPGGYMAAIRAAQLGMEVTLVEKKSMGGTCLNVGCIPTKALLHSANLYRTISKTAKSSGISVEGLEVDFSAMQKKKATIVKQLVSGVGGLMKANGVNVVNGVAEFVSENELKVTNGEEEIRIVSDKILIASGSVPSVVPIPGYDLDGVVDSTGALEFEAVPESLCIIGGGVIGMEMAYLYQTLGTKVTVVEMLPDLLVNMDSDIVEVLKKHLKKNKVDIYLETKVKSIEKSENGLVANVTCPDGHDKAIEAEKVLMCVGRKPAVSQLKLETIGVELERGRVVVDSNYETNVKGVYAIGDCIGGVMLAHVATAEGICAVEKIAGVESNIDMTTIPSCVYTDPELSSVGITEKEAIARGLSYEVGKFPLMGNGKSLIEGDTSGLVKIIADKETKTVLGVHMCGKNATELVVEGALAIHKKATVDDILDTIHAHPSVGESIQEAAHAVFGNALNMPPTK